MTWLKVSCRGIHCNNPKVSTEMVNAVRQWSRSRIKDLGLYDQRFFPQASRPIHHALIGEIRLASIGSKPPLARGIVAIDENLRALGISPVTKASWINAIRICASKENRSSGAQNRPDLFHPVTASVLVFHLL